MLVLEAAVHTPMRHCSHLYSKFYSDILPVTIAPAHFDANGRKRFRLWLVEGLSATGMARRRLAATYCENSLYPCTNSR